MDKDRQVISYQQLIQELRKLCKGEHSGTMFITTDENQSVRFILDKGKIAVCAFRLVKGIDAFSHIQKIKNASFSFAEGVVGKMQKLPLPNTEVILNLLDNKQSFAGMTATEPEDTLSISPSFQVALEKIEHELLKFIGPIAVLVCNEFVENARSMRVLQDLIAMIDKVALEIDDPPREKQFKEQALSWIKEEELSPD